jgi:hypothetical protein
MEARSEPAGRSHTVEVDVAILHVEPAPDAGRLTLATAEARLTVAERHRRGFLRAGAQRARIVAGPPDGLPFGTRLHELLDALGEGGLIVLGSGALPLATAGDRRELVDAAAADHPVVLANNRYSADVVAIARARSLLAEVPASMPSDNALPRWLEEVAGAPVDDRRGRWQLGVDIDGPLDLVLLGGHWATMLGADVIAPVQETLLGVRAVVEDPRAELIIAGRLSAANLGWLEAHTASRTRAFVEERGLRTRREGQRPAASVLGALLDRDGPGSFGEHLTRFGDAAIVDTRVLMAHRFGADETGWPIPEDRFASDMLRLESIADPWLRQLTEAAASAPIPVVLGGHTLVGPGLRLALAVRR